MSLWCKQTGEVSDASAEQGREHAQDFQMFYQDNLHLIYRYAYRKVGNREDAEDLTSLIFLKAIHGVNMELVRFGLGLEKQTRQSWRSAHL